MGYNDSVWGDDADTPAERPPEPEEMLALLVTKMWTRLHEPVAGELIPTHEYESRLADAQAILDSMRAGVAERRDPLEPSDALRKAIVSAAHHWSKKIINDQQLCERVLALLPLLRGTGAEPTADDEKLVFVRKMNELIAERDRFRKRWDEARAELGALRAGGPARTYTAKDFQPGNPVREAYVKWRTKYEDPNATSPDFVAEMLAVVAGALSGGRPAREEPNLVSELQAAVTVMEAAGDAFEKLGHPDEAAWVRMRAKQADEVQARALSSGLPPQEKGFTCPHECVPGDVHPACPIHNQEEK